VFDIGFSELILVFVIGLVVLGPQRLPVAVKTVVGWMRALRSLAANVQNELAQELKLQELQDSLKKVEEASKNSLTPELKASMEELKQSAESMKRSYLGDHEKADDEANTIHNPLVKNAQDSHEGVTPAAADHLATAPAQAPSGEADKAAAVSAAEAPVVHVSPAASEPAAAPASDASKQTPAAAGGTQTPVGETSASDASKQTPAAAGGTQAPVSATPASDASKPIPAAATPASVASTSAPATAAPADGARAATPTPATATQAPAAAQDDAPLSSRAPVSTQQQDER